jgi:hypothetical protein
VAGHLELSRAHVREDDEPGGRADLRGLEDGLAQLARALLHEVLRGLAHLDDLRLARHQLLLGGLHPLDLGDHDALVLLHLVEHVHEGAFVDVEVGVEEEVFQDLRRAVLVPLQL